MNKHVHMSFLTNEVYLKDKVIDVELLGQSAYAFYNLINIAKMLSIKIVPVYTSNSSICLFSQR